MNLELSQAKMLSKSVRNNKFASESANKMLVYNSNSAGLEICSIYGLDDPVEFVEKWMAFSISKLGGADPTVQLMSDFENKELRNQNNASKKPKKTENLERSLLKIYNQESDDEENDILGAYICITPKVS